MQIRSIPDRQPGPRNPFARFGKDEIEQSIPSRFEQQVEKYPDQIAVKTRHRELTYAALNGLANRLGRAILVQRGQRNEPVGLLVEHDEVAIVAMLGILKAGKAYVPLDRYLPPARIDCILEDAEVGLIFTDNENHSLISARVTSLSNNNVAILNTDEIDFGLSGENLDPRPSPDSIAHIFYTSGSSGRPKGVVSDHRTVLHNTMNYTNAFHICLEDRQSMLLPLSGSSTPTDIYCAVLNGARVCPWDFKKDGLVGLADGLAEEGITILHLGPTSFRHFVKSLDDEGFPKVRLVDLAGEVIYRTDVELFTKRFSEDCFLVNRLGSTETYTYRVFFAGRGTWIDGNTVPAGYAVADKEVLLLDPSGRELDFNQMGEITVRSRYMALGYWRRPELTEAAFIPDPTGGPERIYLTGDLGVMRPDGCLEYVGRKDFQLKIRGYRVEVSEVEVTLLDHPGVNEAVVVGRDHPDGDKVLVAYVLLDRQMATAVSELRGFVSDRLPDYMVPADFIVLQAMPLTPNGKIDHSALPAPEVAAGEPPCAPGRARTPVEEAPVAIWSELLGVTEIGAHDNFFDLGGHSLLAARVIVRILDTFRVELPSTSIFERSTIAELAEAIDKRERTGQLLPVHGSHLCPVPFNGERSLMESEVSGSLGRNRVLWR
jgi:amino acid adenylation domain-containing protein